MKKVFILILLTLCILSCNHKKSEQYSTSQESDTVHIIPNSFIMKENLVSFGNDFVVVDNEGNLVGVVKERVLNLAKTFEYVSNKDSVKARARKTILSWGVEIKIYDEKNNYLGCIKEEIFDSFFSIKTIYSIYNQKGEIIGLSKKLDFIGTDIDIYNADFLSVSIKRPMINIMTDKWDININDTLIDKRIIVFIPAYKTSADNDREDESNEKNK